MELVEADLLNDTSLVAACAGATYVMHVASPFFHGDVEEELIPPALEGTMSIMRACQIHKVRRCVITSSIATLIYPLEKPAGPITESIWSSLDNPKMGVYPRSKLLAEKAAWDFHSALPCEEKFDLITLLPSKILGPALRTEASVSIDFCRKLLTGETTEVPYRCFPVVDVRDLAQAHLQAIKIEEAANQRFIVSTDAVWFEHMIAPVAERFCPESWPVPTQVQARPENFDDRSILQLDNTASRTVL
mmetsp:Transcript_25143/g.31542  ORF Transcript_25143/g.31542 Transcript_25143/m.31542 type:complete len:247 (-) Transcript_25143:88-828(-)